VVDMLSKNVLLLLGATLLLFIAGCQTRSISNAGFDSNPFYRGELTEYDIIGEIDHQTITEEARSLFRVAIS
jgi:hypothetical protein